MNSYEFSPAKIARWIEKVGADIRPPIEIELDERHIQDFSKWARKKFPQLFDRMVLGTQRFEMLKTLEYPGKPSVDVSTFTMTRRGPVFMVPRRISEIDLEPDLPRINDVFVESMKQFLKEFVGRRVIRVGKINDYVFDCERFPSVRLLTERFSKFSIPEDGELNIRVNLPDADYNQIFTIAPMIEARLTQPGVALENVGFGINVTVDVNNRKLDKDLSEPQWMTVLHAADIYNSEGIYNVLNCKQEGFE